MTLIIKPGYRADFEEQVGKNHFNTCHDGDKVELLYDYCSDGEMLSRVQTDIEGSKFEISIPTRFLEFDV